MNKLLICVCFALSIPAVNFAEDFASPVSLDPLTAAVETGNLNATDFAERFKDLQLPRIQVSPQIEGYNTIPHSNGRAVTLFQLPVDQAAIIFHVQHVRYFTVYFVARGLGVSLSQSQFEARLKQCMDAISAHTNATPVEQAHDHPQATQGAYTNRKFRWPGTHFVLKGIYTAADPSRRIPFRAEEIVLTMDFAEALPAQAQPVAAAVPTPAQAAELDPDWKIPKSFSLLDGFEKMDLAPKNQGRRGSCTVFATIGVIEYHLARHGENVRLSEQFAAWAANQITKTPSRREGYSVEVLVQAMLDFGITTEDLMPYKSGGVGHPSKAALADAATRKHIGVTWFRKWEYEKKDGFTKDELRAICGCIADGSPVSIVCGWPNSAELDAHSFLLDHRNIGSTSSNGGHAIVLVGYMLDASVDDGGYFLFRQSWGDNWGERGYARISFEYLLKHGALAYAVKLY